MRIWLIVGLIGAGLGVAFVAWALEGWAMEHPKEEPPEHLFI